MRKTSWVCRALILFLCIVGIGYAISPMIAGEIYEVLIRLSIILTAFVPTFLRKIFHIDLTPEIEIIYLIFVFFGHFLGSIVGWYNTVYGYDKIVHAFSGILTGGGALILLKNLHLYHSKNLVFNIIFMISFTLAIASLWEFFEYICDLFFGANAQHVKGTGVGDTMQDMIAAFLGSLVLSGIYLYEIIKKKKRIIYHLVEE